ncbi:hypothetical protein BJY24_005798 [Nocardia transvalensis]|uniref:Uncharacterized protein n=1 Tax=Nocardia transvalensis TaxID=37333 RepID=A0A7W9PIP5_9NOCA|nr:hypothetical protein [Nocardia transvalensis]MBB5916886.1 hypothetical protein [Nocardia transvalensis]
MLITMDGSHRRKPDPVGVRSLLALPAGSLGTVAGHPFGDPDIGSRKTVAFWRIDQSGGEPAALVAYEIGDVASVLSPLRHEGAVLGRVTATGVVDMLGGVARDDTETLTARLAALPVGAMVLSDASGSFTSGTETASLAFKSRRGWRISDGLDGADTLDGFLALTPVDPEAAERNMVYLHGAVLLMPILVTVACPRCGEPWGADPPGRSRMTVERELQICSRCGTDEAARDAARLPPIEPSAWPVAGGMDWGSVASG